MVKTVEIYTDGSANNKTKQKGGVGFVAIYGKHIRHFSDGAYEPTTSNRMEIMAVLEALKFVKPEFKVTIYSDSQYVVNTFKKGWIFNWAKYGYKLNEDLWRQVLSRYRQFPRDHVKFVWIRGHNGTQYNEIADQLAKQGGQREQIKPDTID